MDPYNKRQIKKRKIKQKFINMYVSYIHGIYLENK